MLDHRTTRFRLFKVLVIAHIFIACFPLFQSASGDRSRTLAAYRRLKWREPAPNFRAFEHDDNGKLLLDTEPIYNAAINENVNYGLRRSAPPTTLSRSHRRQSNFKKTEPESKKRDLNVNMNNNVPQNSDIASLLGHVTYKDSGKDSTVSGLEAKLYGCVVFRGNIIKVFGQILNAPNNGLTIDQYSSLNLILQSLIHKHVYMFNLLPVLKKIQGADKKTQFRVVMQALVKQVPVYLACSCKFWVNQIDDNHVDIEELLSFIEEPADFLTDIDPEVIDTCKNKVAADELEPFDEASIITKNTIGPVFVNIFGKLRDRQMVLTQKLFGAILVNMPIAKLNPVLEEYVNYIWDITQENQLTNWNKIVNRIPYGNPYDVIFSAIIELLNRKDTSDMDRTALLYILLHLKDASNAVPDEYHEDMEKLLDKDLNVPLLFSIVPNDPAIPEMNQLKTKMIAYLQRTNKDILQRINKYVYNKPLDLLIALLTRIQGTIVKHEIKTVASKLLSILTSKRELDIFGLSVSPNIDFLTLLKFLEIEDPYFDKTVLVMQLENYFKSDLDAPMILQSIILNEDKNNCNRPMQCLLNVFVDALKMQDADHINMPSSVVTIIKELVKSVVTTMNNSVECYHDVTYVECPNPPNNSIDLDYQSTSNVTQTTGDMIFESSNPTIPSLPPISTDYQEPIHKPEYPNESDNESFLQTTITHEPLEEFSQPTLSVNSPINPDGWSEHPLLVDTTEQTPMPTYVSKPSAIPEADTKPKPVSISKPKPSLPKPKPPSTLKPKPRPPFGPVEKPSPIFTIIQGFRPPLIPVVMSPIHFSNKKPMFRPPALPPTIAQDFVPEDQAQNEYTEMGPQFQPIGDGPVLPPNIYYDQEIFIVFPSDDAPPYIVPEKPRVPGDFGHIIEFPSIKALLKGFSAGKQFEANELPDLPAIFRPLEQMFGPDFVEEILGKDVDKFKYPTTVSLIDDLLEHALEHPKVLENTELALLIQLYLKGIDYLSTTALFPVVVDSRKILSDVLHVTFDPNNPNANSVDSEPPRKIPPGFTTLSIYHPKYWVQLVDPVNPYGTLLPNFEGDEDNPIQKLMNDGSAVQEILGPNFDPLTYPNKGTLLTAVLQRLMLSNQVKSEPLLMRELNAYLESIRTIALFSKVPNDYYNHFREFQRSNKPNWQPDTASLIKALPPPHNQSDLQKINAIKSFLGTPNLLESLRIDIPSYYTTRGALLKMIFQAASQGDKLPLDPKVMAALKYYQNKILTRGNGALPIVWTWVGMVILREEIPLGEVIETVLDYDTLPANVRPDYNELMTYLSENPNLLRENDDFAFDRYHTKGTFLRGFFKHFMKKHNVASKAKKLLKKIIPYIAITGRGMQPMNYMSVNDIANRRIEKKEFSVSRNG